MIKTFASNTSKNATPTSAGRRSWASWAGFAALVVLTMPFVLSLYYAVLPPPVSSLMLQRLLAGEGIDYRWVTLGTISPELPRAVIAAEDARFCEHGGVDWLAVQEVVGEAFDEDEQPIRGASTIAMQTAKNLFLWGGDRSSARLWKCL
jgi:monofunctional biosynthetic peptidoglycan transglycosylase